MKNERKIVGVYPLCNFGGLVVLDLNSETVTTGFEYGDGVKSVYTTPIKYDNNGEPYLTRYGRDYYFSDIMRL